MKILRLADRPSSRWKNGRGETWEYAVHPPGAGIDEFFWRISRARVTHHTSFSVFPGVDRTLTLVGGEAIDLLLRDRRVRLDATTPPYRFRGDIPIECRVPSGPIDDLNVMTRRTHWRHRVDRLRLAAPTTVALDGDVAVLVAIDPVRLAGPGEAPAVLEPGDAALFESPVAIDLAPRHGHGSVVRIALDHVASPLV